MDSYARASNFTQCMENKQRPIMHQINAVLEERRKKNSVILESIVETVLFCGRQNVALRGHRDDSVHSKDPSLNTGNFKALLKYRADGGDSELGSHLEYAPKNATYVSKTTQNEIINIIGQDILDKIVSNCVSSGGYYSLSADEVRGVGNQEQLAVTIRYVDKAGDIREDFLAFVDVSEVTTGENLSTELLNLIDRVGQDAKKMRSQCYDGAGNMAGLTKGVGPRIQRQYPKALPFWCTAHQLNRCIVQTCAIPVIRNMMGTSDQVVRFFEFSPKKQNSLEEVINNLELGNHGHKLKELCRTRWVERHDALELFINLMPAIVETLESYASLPNTRTPGAADARSLLHSICNFEFIVCITIVHKCLSFLRGLSRSLQERTLDVVRALKTVSIVKSSLQECRNKVDVHHSTWFREAATLAWELDVAISKHRTCRRQTKRDNVPADTPEEYYRKPISIPMLDHLLEEMNTRFSDLHQRAALGLLLVPSALGDSVDVDELKDFFKDDLPLPSSLDAELMQWTSYWKEKEDKPNSLVGAIKGCDRYFFQNVAKIFKICATFPVTSCECQRGISVLSLLKTFLRSTMGQDRLNLLALMFINRNVTVNAMGIVKIFARKNPRKLELPNILFEE